MDRRTAKREACWRAANVLRSALGAGWDLGEDYGEADVAKVEAGLADLIEELERRGHK